MTPSLHSLHSHVCPGLFSHASAHTRLSALSYINIFDIFSRSVSMSPRCLSFAASGVPQGGRSAGLHPPCVSSRAHHPAHYIAHGHMQRRAYMRALADVYSASHSHAKAVDVQVYRQRCGLAAASPTLLLKRNMSELLRCDGIPAAVICASVSRWACRKRRRKNSPCMRVEEKFHKRPSIYYLPARRF